MSGYHILGGIVPPFQVLQQQNAGLPPGGVPPWYAQQFPAGYVPPLLVSVDNPLEPDAFDAFDEVRFRGERDRADLARSGLPSGLNIPVYLGIEATDPGYVQTLAAEFAAKLDRYPLTFEAAAAVANAAIAMTQQAGKIARANASLLGPAVWEGPAGHIRWHQAAIKSEIAGRDPKATIYPREADLKKWAVQCFRAVTAVSQERDVLNSITSEFWRSVPDILLEAGQNLLRIPGRIVERVTGVPLWAWSLGTLALLGLTGFAAYKILLAIAPVAAPAVIGRYLPAPQR